MKEKIKADYKSGDIYKKYLSTTKSKNPVVRTIFVKILKEFFGGVVEDLIYKGSEFSFPYKLGTLRIRKSKVKLKLDANGNIDKRRLRPDWGSTRKLWKSKYPNLSWEEIKNIKNKPILYHENKHSDRWQHTWYWNRSTCVVKNSTAYSLDMSRDNDRYLAKALKRDDVALDYSIF